MTNIGKIFLKEVYFRSQNYDSRYSKKKEKKNRVKVLENHIVNTLKIIRKLLLTFI